MLLRMWETTSAHINKEPVHQTWDLSTKGRLSSLIFGFKLRVKVKHQKPKPPEMPIKARVIPPYFW
jgi:hypothetical protein